MLCAVLIPAPGRNWSAAKNPLPVLINQEQNVAAQSSVSLTELVQHLPGVISRPRQDARISGLQQDSRLVMPGDLFIALEGGSADGHRFIPGALERGAAAVMGTQPLGDLPAPYVQVEDGRLALAHLAAAFYGYPARQMMVIGVTGTDGKTTTSNLIYHVLQAAGLRAGMITTVNALIGDQELDTGFHVTTPEAPQVQSYLAQMAQAGLEVVVLEATSHGLAQRRVEASEFDIAVVTNITHEHLDYHGSYEAYREAKGRLFESAAATAPKPFAPPRGAVINRDDSSYAYLLERTQAARTGREGAFQIVTYGMHAQADVRAENVEHLPAGLRFHALGPGWRTAVETRLVGAYNVSNCLAALGLGVEILGLEPQKAAQGIAALPGVPGRMERIDLGQNFTAIVDFAHTPFALKSALEAGREMADSSGGRLIAVFGSAGLRDRLKRRMMAETAAEMADISILTAEDPRTESLEGILAEMAAGAESRGGIDEETFYRIGDRREAIRFAVRIAREGDIVMACGKGHEQSMCFGTTEYLWDDRTAMRAALAELLGVAGPEMPYLPEAK
jgi:UDP-N-acetylmuramoyl-L-alanyl-D-glutamate--2,6-diaminopimelate ligase